MGLVHLFMNLLALKYFGPPLETVIGAPLLLGVFLFSGICGSLLSVWQLTGLSVGASGAVLGLLSAAIMLEWIGGSAAKKLARYENLGTLLFILGVNLLIGTVEKGIDNSAHIGGLIGGAIAGLAAAVIIRVPVATRLAEALVIVISCFTLGWAGHQFATVETSTQYPANLRSLKPLQHSTLPLNLALPDTWVSRLSSDTGTLQELSVQGAFGERLDISWGLNAEPPEQWVRTYAEARTRTIAGDELVRLKAVSDPATSTVGIWQVFRIQWRLAAQAHPLVIRDYALFHHREMVLIQCLIPTELAHLYDSLFQKIIESITFKKENIDEDP
ncbi:MAG TPA: rhomboid family intramembrane serine protease, partial [Candidatus Ozemobacteraceae bacterium]|nr:rhomboid family intramembrane serine protease [Candidatus Ozemobacteraceae bacterium]